MRPFLFECHISLCYTVRAILSHATVTGHIGKKFVKGQLWAEVTHVAIWGHMNVLPSISQVI